jgi:hypothetical protein
LLVRFRLGYRLASSAVQSRQWIYKMVVLVNG